ncbi:MAG: hypothetical protein Greene041614_537 [Parcubacteria group bacterium Greene0416_14]|nr:MAG: hypothetical protein Greene041614_537 [Parcubacteria group bacterium Greene0416_14]
MLVGVIVQALLGLFLLGSALLVWNKVYTLFQSADTTMDAYLPVFLGGVVFLLASGLIYQMGTGVVTTIVKSVGAGG